MKAVVHLLTLAFVVLIGMHQPTVFAEDTEKTSRIQGTIMEGSKQGITGVLVRIRPEGAEQPIWLTATDRNGRFKIESVPDGDYRVDLYRAGYKAVSKERVSIRFPFRAVVEQPLEAGSDRLAGELPASWNPQTSSSAATGDDHATDRAVLSGELSTRDGGPLAEVQIRLVHAAGNEDPRALRTDEQGRFVALELSPGNWMLEVRGLGYLPMRTPLALVAGDSRATLVLTPQPPEYEPTARDLLPVEQPTLPFLMGDNATAESGEASPQSAER